LTWGQLGQSLADHAFSSGLALGTTFGLGGGAGLITFLHHMPAPYEDQLWLGAVYDTFQDRAKNTEKIGARRKRVKEIPPSA
jgi:hypothetical protein